MIPEWLTYEHQAVERHASTYPKSEVHHWSRVPESMLIDAGYIHDVNQWRLDRKRRFKPDEPTPNPVSDYGLDGLARISPTEFHGIQAKRRKVGSYLRAKDLGSFMAVAQRMRVKHAASRGVVYTDSKLTRELADDLALVPGYDVVHMPLALPETMPGEPAALTLWPHQLEAIAALQAWDGQRGVLVMPPGSGKTMVMATWGRTNARIVVCSPTRALAQQTLDAMGRMMPEHRRLLVDSDSVGTRDSTAVQAAWAAAGALLISTTYASMCDLVADVVAGDAVVMIDEGHHWAGSLHSATEALQSRLLLVTGTPPSAILDDDDDDQLPVVYQYHYDRAVQDGRICDFRIYVPLIVDPVGDVDHDDLVAVLGADIVSKCHFLTNGMLRTGATRCIIYADSVDEANVYYVALPRLAAQFHGVAAWTGIVTGDTPELQRRQQLTTFQAYDPMFRWYFMCSVRVLDEGIDIPACDAVYIANSVGNQSRFVQRMCRANRLDYPGKVANVFVWSDFDLDATLKATARVAATLRADRASNVVLVSTNYACAVNPAAEASLVDRVRVLCVTVSEKWEMQLHQVEALILATNKRPSKKSSDAEERRIGEWISTQLKNYSTDGPADSKCIMKTSEIHTTWTLFMKRHGALFETAEASWRRSAAQAEAMMVRSSKRLSTISSNSDERQLSTWIYTQVSNYSIDGPAASKNIMKTPEIHTVWGQFVERHAALMETSNQKWYRSVSQAGAMMVVNNRRPSTTSNNPEEKRIGAWISNQMSIYGDMPATSKAIMQTPEIHTAWGQFVERHAALFKTAEESWHQSALQAEAVMVATNKRPSVTLGDSNEKRLGSWINTQLCCYSRDGPEASKYIMQTPEIHTAWTQLVERHALLFETSEQTWHRSAAQTEAMMLANGKRPQANSRDPDEKRLATWIGTQRKNYSRDGPEASKNIMQTPEIHTAWTQLVERHAALFCSATKNNRSVVRF